MANQCTHAPSKWVGIVQNHAYIPNLPHASKSVCGRPACIENAKQWVLKVTGEPGQFLAYKDIGD